MGNTSTSRIKTGYCGLLGNKGAVGTSECYAGLSLCIGAKRMLFVNSHLNADKTSNQKRNKDLLQILKKLVD